MPASLTSSTLNLINTVIGAGVLSIPYAFRAAGWLTAIFIILLVWSASSYAFVVLARCSEATDCFTYKGIALVASGKVAALIAEVMILGYCFGNLIGRVIILGEVLPFIVEALDSSCKDDDAAIYCERSFLISVVTAAVLLPLSLLPRMDMLKFSSLFSVLCIVLVIFVVVDEFALRSRLHSPGQVIAVHSSFVLFMAFPILVVSFTAHYNLPRMYEDLKERTVGNMSKVVSISTTVCLVAYGVMGQCGYMAFRDATPSNILSADYITDEVYDKKPLAMIAYCALACSISLSFPLVCFAVRGSIETLFFPGRPFSWARHVVVTVCIAGIALLVGNFVDDLAIVFALMGSTVGVGFVYILPGMFYAKLVGGSDDLKQSLIGDSYDEEFANDGAGNNRIDSGDLMSDQKEPLHRRKASPVKKTCESTWGPRLLIVFGVVTGVLGVTATLLKAAGVIALPVASSTGNATVFNVNLWADPIYT